LFQQLTPQLLKPAVNLALRRLLDPIQNEFTSSPEWQEVSFLKSILLPCTLLLTWQQIEKKAYPTEAPKEKKQKTKKDKGSKYPGAAKAEEQAEQGKEPSQATASDVGKSASEAMDKLSVQ